MKKQHQQQQHGGLAEPFCCVKFMKIFLFIFNLIVLVLGIVALAIGIWSLNDDYGADNVEVIMDTDLYSAVSIILIIGGAVVIVTSALGIVGVVLSNKTMLIIYFAIMVTFCIIFIVGAVTTFFFLDEVEGSLADKMESTLKNRYHVNITTNDKNNDVTTVWDDIQKKLECCGVRGGLKSSESWFLWQSSQWFETEGKAAPLSTNYIYVPTTCCDPDYLHSQCQSENIGQPTQPPQTSINSITAENPALYHTGCLDALEEKISDHIIGISIVAVLIFLLMILCAVFSIMVAMETGRIGHVV